MYSTFGSPEVQLYAKSCYMMPLGQRCPSDPGLLWLSPISWRRNGMFITLPVRGYNYQHTAFYCWKWTSTRFTTFYEQVDPLAIDLDFSLIFPRAVYDRRGPIVIYTSTITSQRCGLCQIFSRTTKVSSVDKQEYWTELLSLGLSFHFSNNKSCRTKNT